VICRHYKPYYSAISGVDYTIILFYLLEKLLVWQRSSCRIPEICAIRVTFLMTMATWLLKKLALYAFSKELKLKMMEAQAGSSTMLWVMYVVNLNYIPSQATNLVQAYYETVWRLIVNNTQIISCFTACDLVVLCTEISLQKGLVLLSTQEYYIPYLTTAIIVLYEWSHLKKCYIKFIALS